MVKYKVGNKSSFFVTCSNMLLSFVGISSMIITFSSSCSLRRMSCISWELICERGDSWLM